MNSFSDDMKVHWLLHVRLAFWATNEIEMSSFKISMRYAQLTPLVRIYLEELLPLNRFPGKKRIFWGSSFVVLVMSKMTWKYVEMLIVWFREVEKGFKLGIYLTKKTHCALHAFVHVPLLVILCCWILPFATCEVSMFNTLHAVSIFFFR